MNKKTTIIGIIVLLVVIFAGYQIFKGPAELVSKEPIKIGVIIPRTGDAASYGENIYEALEIALEEINEKGILGRKVEIIYEDTKCESKEGATAANKLININKVDLMLATECSGPTLTAIPVVKAAKKIFIIGIATVPGIADAKNLVFRITPSDALQGKDLANAMIKLGYNKPAILYSNDEYGSGVKDTFVANKGNMQVATIEAFPLELIDTRTHLTKIKNTKPDSLLIVGHNPSHYKMILKQIKELGLDVPVLASETFKDENLLKDIKDLMEGVFVTYYESPENNKRNELNSRIQQKYGKDLGTYGDFAYDGLYVIKEAIEKAKSLYSQNIHDALVDLSYDGVTGLTAFDETGEVKTKSFTLFQVKNGEFVKYEE